MSADTSNLKSIFLALGANIAIAIAKLFAALKTGSGSMMAEAIHSFSDSINQVLLLIGIKKSKRPPSSDFPLGYGKEIYFYSFLVSILIFSMGGLFSLYEGIHKLESTEPISNPWIAIGVLVFAIFAEGFAFFGCLAQVNKIRGQKSLYKWMKETRKTQLLVILGEDLSAMIGLTLALVAISIAVYTGNPVYDAYGSICIGTLLILVSIMLSKEIKNLLIGRGVSPETKAAYIERVESHEEIVKVFNAVTMEMGEDVLLAIKIQVKPELSANELINTINKAEVDLKQTFPEIAWLFVEPDNKN